MGNLGFRLAGSLLCLAAWGCADSSGEAPAGRAPSEHVGRVGPTLRASIHPNLPEFFFTLRGQPLDASGGIYRVERIEIRRGAAAEPVQVIEGLETETPISDNSPRLEVLDMNFDDYGDLRIVEFPPAGPNVPYLNWLFDPASARFVRAAELDAIASPVFDRKTGRIRSAWRDGATRYGTDIYSVIEGKPVLVRKELKEYSKPGAYRWTVMERIEGNWKTVEQKVVRE
ncbi:MAG: hypothetical protein OEP48_08910 [Betaproteobacteria bacterium]|nr:hypothetical protein [Betaproteobacteria bacterium]MDH3436431.1 hypothetical protein [Betaproteobacteria bacterium]